MSNLVVTIPANPPDRLDKALALAVPEAAALSRSRLSRLIADGAVSGPDGIVRDGKARVSEGQDYSIAIPDPEPVDTRPEAIPLSIAFEDEDLIVIDKPAGMVVHPGHGNWDGTLVNALAFHFEKNHEKSDLDRVGLVHRIDKDTSGLLVVAKNEYALSFLAKQFFNRTTKRLYWAFVWGNLPEDEGTIRGHIGRHQKNRMQMAVYEDGSHGKHAVTHYKVLERFRYMTWVECKLETGRTHQIRAHFRHIGHTLFNDERYEGHIPLRGSTLPKYKQFISNVFEILPRQALHAHTLGFVHPVTKKEMYFESPMPQDMEEAVKKWRKYLENA